jgi:hypothetical protein
MKCNISKGVDNLNKLFNGPDSHNCLLIAVIMNNYDGDVQRFCMHQCNKSPDEVLTCPCDRCAMHEIRFCIIQKEIEKLGSNIPTTPETVQ